MLMRSLAFLVVAMTLLAGSALSPLLGAQTTPTVASANIPFDFRLGDRTMPGGLYHFHRPQGDLLQLDGPRDGAFVLVWREQSSSTRPSEKAAVIFRHGDGYEFKGLRLPQQGTFVHSVARPKSRVSKRQVQSQTTGATIDVAIVGAPF